MTQSIDARSRLADQTAEEAGALALHFFDRLSELKVETKGPQDVVSKADREVEDLIRRRIQERFPGDLILGEEAGGAVSLDADETIWVIDPIDGTQCFLNGLSTWCVSIALVQGGDIVHGTILDPSAGELFSGGPETGARVNGAPMKVAEARNLSEGMVEVGYSTRCTPDLTLDVLAKLMPAGGMYHRCGAGALALAHLAAGRYIAYFEEHMNSWDSLAGAALVRGAGGWTSDLLANDGLNLGAMVVAAGPGLLGEMRRIVRVPFDVVAASA